MAVKTKARSRKPKNKSSIRYEKRMSDNCRRPSHVKDAFLEWLNSRNEFAKRPPTPDEVVQEARKKGSPIRCILEHDVNRAAYKHWYSEAQYLLRHVVVVKVLIKTNQDITKPVRYFIPIKTSKDGHIKNEDYIPAGRVAESLQMRMTVLQRAHSDFLLWLARYERYAEFMEEFSPVIAAYRRIEETVLQNGEGKTKAG